MLRLTVGALFFFTAGLVHAADTIQPDNHPSPTYSGSAPIDLSRGPLFTNGTFGDLNPAREEAVQGSYSAPGLFAAPYPFAQKEHFVETVNNLMNIYREALENLKTNSDSREAIVEHRKEMSQNLKERLDKAESALKDASASTAQNWDEKQKTARNAFTDLQALLVRTR
jgi:hypothetical protein